MDRLTWEISGQEPGALKNDCLSDCFFETKKARDSLQLQRFWGVQR